MLPDRRALEAHWLRLTRDEMPAVARERRWPVFADHCFQRILLDNACGGRWYDQIALRPAYRYADATILTTAVELGEQALNGRADLSTLNASSLAWRR